MSDPDLRARLLAEKYRLIGERDALDDWIIAMRIAIDALQEKAMPPASPTSNEAAKSYKAAYVTRPAAAATGKKPAPIKKSPAEPISFKGLIAKAAEWGIPGGDVPLVHTDLLLAAVNERAVRIGHKPYVLQSRSP